MKKEEVLSINFTPVNEEIKNDTSVYACIEDEFCPICGEIIFRNGRCKTCFECGWSSCEI